MENNITIATLRQSYIDRTFDDIKRALAYIAILGGSPSEVIDRCLDEVAKIPIS